MQKHNLKAIQNISIKSLKQHKISVKNYIENYKFTNV